MTDYGWVRVSSGSQDDATQRARILDYAPDAIIVTADTKSASASKGDQVDAVYKLIRELRPGDRIIVTESSRLDRREDLDAQAEVLLAVRQAGADVVSLSEAQFGKTDFAGRIVTLVAQHANWQKSKTVIEQTWRGVQPIIANKAHYGHLPAFWEAVGDRYTKQAVCVNAAAVRDIYARVDAGESLASIGRAYGMYPQSLRNVLRFEANHTGVITCRYTYDGETVTWPHEVTPVVDSALWWRVNTLLNANASGDAARRGGRPVAAATGWLSGVLSCPECGGALYVDTGKTPAGNPRTPKLRCGGQRKTRQSCRRFTNIPAAWIADAIDGLFRDDRTPLLAFRRVTGNAHELDELKASLAAVQARLSAVEDDDELDRLVAERKALKAAVASFRIIPDTYAYEPIGQTVADMWTAGDDTVKRAMAKAVKASPWGLDVVCIDGEWGVSSGGPIPGDDAIVDLGAGICFRRTTRAVHRTRR